MRCWRAPKIECRSGVTGSVVGADQNGSGAFQKFRLGDRWITPSLNEIEGVRVEPKVMDVLVALMETAPAVVSSQALLERVWPDVVVVDNVVYQTIAQLRKALGDDAQAPRYVQTVPRRGYRLIAEIRGEQPTDPSLGSEVPAPPLRVPSSAARSHTRPRSFRKWIAIGVSSAVALAVAVWVLSSRILPRDDTTTDVSIVVDDFEALGGTQEFAASANEAT